MSWDIGQWAKHEEQRVRKAIAAGPAAIQTLVDDYEARVQQNKYAGESDWFTLHGNALWALYKAGGNEKEGDPYYKRNEYLSKAIHEGWEPEDYGTWKSGQEFRYFDPETGTASDDITAMPETYQEANPDTGDSDSWREMRAPPNWIKSMASKEGGEMQLQYMAMQNALEGRNAAVDQLASFDEEAQALSAPVISPEDEAAMLSQSSGTIAKSYENQRLGATHAMGMRGIDPRSGVNQDLSAAMRFAALSQDANTAISTKLQNKQLNRGALERAMGLRAGIQGSMANLMAGRPLSALAASSAAMINEGNMYQVARNDAKSDALSPLESLGLGFGDSLLGGFGEVLGGGLATKILGK
jgi:hypothetical protein